MGWLAALALVASVCAASAADGVTVSGADRVLTNAQQVLDLGLERARGSDIPVRLRAVLTYVAVHKPEWFFIQDEAAAIMVVSTNQPFGLRTGQLLEVEGVAAAGIWMPFVQASAIRLVGEAPLPKPKPALPPKLAAGEDFGRWVEISGTVRDVAVTKKRLLLQCADNGLVYQVWIAHPGELALPYDVLDAKLRMQGIAWPDVGYERRPFGFKLHLPGTNYLQVLKPGSADVFRAPPRSIASLRQFKGDRDTRVKITAVVTAHSPLGWISVQDDTGTLLAWQLAALPRDAVFVNVGRGQVVDEAALLREAAAGRIRVALDVVESEPLVPASAFCQLPGAVLSPHIGGPTFDQYPRCGEQAWRNIARFLEGATLECTVSLADYDRAT
jgi:hypothetical protein